MNFIITAVIVLGLIALVAAVALFAISKKFAVHEDSRIGEVQELLPGANCGGCGFAGCSGLAEALVKGADAGSIEGLHCPVGGSSVMEQVSDVLGLATVASEPCIAVVRCGGKCSLRPQIAVYDGARSCATMHMAGSGESSCGYGCLGCGDCERACPFDAIHINPETRLPEVSDEACTACGKCVTACPRHIIKLRRKGPKNRRVYVACMNRDKGAVARKGCEVACIGCGKCEKVCEFDAITIDGNLSYINSYQCRLCTKCVDECPTGAILKTNFPVKKSIEREKGGERMKLFTFKRGGIHPDENKLTHESPTMVAPLPSSVIIPLQQHIGAPAKAVVQRGDKVKVGTLIGEASAFVSANIYSSVSGTVKKVDTCVDATGYRIPAVYIDVEGDDWEPGIDRSETLEWVEQHPELTPEEIVLRVKRAGVTGMGGAGFPTHIKLTPPPGNQADCVIINAVECEPYITSDYRLMMEHADEIVEGVKLIMKAVSVKRAYIGIEENKPHAIALMRDKTRNDKEIEVVALKQKYPQGGEKQLIEAITGREVPAPPAIPVNVGVVVQNVGTAMAVYQAVMKNKPLFERYTTVTGKQIARPANYLVRMGTPFGSLIELCGGLPDGDNKILAGGPMMGRSVESTDVPVCKGTNSITVLSGDDAHRKAVQPCIRCGKCVEVCPMGLEPYLMAQLTMVGDYERLEREQVTSCIACGSCQYTCPAHRPLLDTFIVGKGHVMTMIRERNKK